MIVITMQDAVDAIARNLDRIDGVPAGTQIGVAKRWLEGISTIVIDDDLEDGGEL